MKVLFGLALCALALPAAAQEQEIQRSVIQRDQQSAEFAARVRGADVSRLEQLHARQLTEAVRPLQPELDRSFQRQRMADERTLVLPPPAVTLVKLPEKPLPLPGGPEHGVDPIPVQGPGH
jgi:hypothetical protein